MKSPSSALTDVCSPLMETAMPPPRPRWEHLLSEMSKWDDRIDRQRTPGIELAIRLIAMSVLLLSLLAEAASPRLHFSVDTARAEAAAALAARGLCMIDESRLLPPFTRLGLAARHLRMYSRFSSALAHHG